MKRTRLNPISDKKREQMKAELAIRNKLCERAGGLFVTDGTHFRCIGGKCEGCGRAPSWIGLHPHEKIFRSQGGKLSMENTVMVCGRCHSAEHGIKEG